MSDPMMRRDPTPSPTHPVTPSLFTATSRQAGETAARMSTSRRAQILKLLADRGPLAIFEIAAAIGCLDHQISGRFGELEQDGLIAKSGQRARKPDMGQECERYCLADKAPPPARKLAEAMGYPAEIRLDDGIYHLAAAQDPQILGDIPGYEYLRFTQGDVPRLSIRVVLIQCPACGAPLRSVGATDRAKLLTCANHECPGGSRGYEAKLLNEPGRAPFLGLLLRRF